MNYNKIIFERDLIPNENNQSWILKRKRLLSISDSCYGERGSRLSAKTNEVSLGARPGLSGHLTDGLREEPLLPRTRKRQSKHTQFKVHDSFRHFVYLLPAFLFPLGLDSEEPTVTEVFLVQSYSKNSYRLEKKMTSSFEPLVFQFGSKVNDKIRISFPLLLQ